MVGRPITRQKTTHKKLMREVRPSELRCVKIMRDGDQCWRWLGDGTKHDGVGHCEWHDKTSATLWEDLVDVARQQEITPWEALLTSVRLAAGRVAWVDEQLTEAVRRNDGDMTVPEIERWLTESRKERTLLARVSKAAIDSGVAERMVRQIELEGQAVAAAVAAALDRLNLPHEQRVIALEAAHARLLAGPEGNAALGDSSGN